MKGVRFYLEFPTATAKRTSGKANTGHNGNVFAGFVANGYRVAANTILLDGVGAVMDYPNSPVASCSADMPSYLRKLCKRVPEKQARLIHPNLFRILDIEEKGK